MKALKYILALILVLSLAIPAMAGNGPGGPGGGGKGGGKGDIPDTGELYGDLYVILRDENGIPIFDGNGCLQPISTTKASVTIETDGDPLTIYAFAGQPFSLAYYTDPAGDLVECELTEEMATWVQTVDFGRLNLGRAPDSVIAHAFDEAIKKMNAATEIGLDPAGRLVLTLPDTETEDPTDTVDKTIDAPAEALALYIAMMTQGDWYTEDTTPIVHGGLPTGMGPPEGDGPSAEPRPVLTDTAVGHLEHLGFTNLGDPYDGVIGAGDLNKDELLLAASLLAAAADKTGSITLDKVVYINFIYGINQLGTLTDAKGVKTYFDFGDFTYDRETVYRKDEEDGNRRSSGSCTYDPDYGPGWVEVLQPELDVEGNEVPDHFVTTCMDLLGYDPDTNPLYNSVRFVDMVNMEGEYITDWETDENNVPTNFNLPDPNSSPVGITLGWDFNSNVRGFAQAADDALQVIEYIHNYKIPEVLYP